MEVEVDSKEAGVALITGQIVEAWLNRQPIAKGAVSAAELADIIVAARVSLSCPLVGLEAAAVPQKPGLRLVDPA